MVNSNTSCNSLVIDLWYIKLCPRNLNRLTRNWGPELTCEELALALRYMRALYNKQNRDL